jgi:hypothetical protein
MPGSLIEQLQMEAVDRNVRTSDLLRKALLVASRLDIPGVPEWINKELSGYELKDVVPAYRRIHGRVMARTFHGWRPVQFPTNEVESMITEQTVISPWQCWRKYSPRKETHALIFRPKHSRFYKHVSAGD